MESNLSFTCGQEKSIVVPQLKSPHNAAEALAPDNPAERKRIPQDLRTWWPLPRPQAARGPISLRSRKAKKGFLQLLRNPPPASGLDPARESISQNVQDRLTLTVLPPYKKGSL
jgi:hypothetical protein